MIEACAGAAARTPTATVTATTARLPCTGGMLSYGQAPAGRSSMTRKAVTVAVAAAIAVAFPTGAPASIHWQRLGPSLLTRQEVTATAVGGSIYVVGGFKTGAMLTRDV